jgi:hypothetical protein
MAYWTSFAEFLRARHSDFAFRPIGFSMLQRFPINRTDFQIIAMIVIRSRRAVVGLFTPRASNKMAFQALFSQKAAIESEIGEPLDWQVQPSKKRSQISISLGGIDPADQAGYPELHAWMLDKMERMQAVFSPRIRLLPPYETEGADNEEVDDADLA